MIRINLLPYREKEQKAGIARQFIVMGAVLGAFLVLVLAVHLVVSSKISGLEEEIQTLESDLERLTKVVGDVEQYKEDKRVVEKKLAVIAQLEHNRLGPVRLLDGLTQLVPTEDVWLDRLSQSGTDLRIEGVARDNIAVVKFMKNLEGSDLIRSVDLQSTKETEISGIKLQKFILSCAMKRG
ncbi:MAG: PilN domain-containing protein [Deltaproteobacteria bacterium]|nr:PilN domain-containing protein [Deltaproteobacteria bacterium]